jgi:hypothetical protein
MYNRLCLLCISFILAACVGANTYNAANAVESYLQALISKDENQMVYYSCADWEPEASLEYNSFAAVEVDLDSLNCQEAGQDGDFTLVNCTGKITANYGAEVLEIELDERTFQVLLEGGEWRMCGYR